MKPTKATTVKAASDGDDDMCSLESLPVGMHETTCERMTSCRWLICYTACASRVAVSMLRQCVGMAIVCMNTRRHSETDVIASDVKATQVADVVPQLNASSRVLFADNVTANWQTEFNWSSEFEGLVLASFTFGFAASPVVGGYMSGRFGGKNIVTVALVMGGLLSLLTPASTRFHPALLVTLRVLTGAFMGVVEPAHQSLWAVWAPKQEKSRMTSTAFSGVAVAGILSFSVSGFLCSIPADGGWPFIFYVIGGYSLLMAAPWHYVVYNSPREHPRLSEREAKLLALTNSRAASANGAKMPPPPWMKIFSSPAVLAILVAHVTFSWVTSLAMAYLPMYMKQVLAFNIQQVGVLSSLPFLGRFVLCLAVGYLSDWLITRRYLSTIQCRRLVQMTGCLVCACCVMVVSWMGREQSVLVVLLLVIGLSFQNSTSVAFRVNHLDIAPRYASVLLGITVSCAMVASLSAPLITSAIIKKGVKEEWQQVYWIVAALCIIGSVVFVTFARAEEQDWAKVYDDPEKEPEDSSANKEEEDSFTMDQDKELLLPTFGSKPSKQLP